MVDPRIIANEIQHQKGWMESVQETGDRSNESHKVYWKTRNAYTNAIEKSKKEHWDNFLENVDHKSMWTTNRYATGEHTDGSRTRIPTLRIKWDNG